MKKFICAKCREASIKSHEHPDDKSSYSFVNDDSFLLKEVERISGERDASGLEGLVGGLEFVIINTEPKIQVQAVKELLRYTGLCIRQVFENDESKNYVLGTDRSADFIISSRKGGDNPFAPFNLFPKSSHLPNTRLETLVFSTPDLEKYVTIQKARGVYFLTKDIIRYDNYLFIQTAPSVLTGNSIGFVQWTGKKGNYLTGTSREISLKIKKPALEYLNNIKWIDHVATRVRAQDRNAAVIEFMNLTNYNFDFAIYISSLNSITSVTRLTPKEFALVFTSGIAPSIAGKYAGPTEKYIKNYGQRVHHMAFHTENIEHTFDAVKKDGMEFLIELVGSPQEGLRQTFTKGSENTLIVNEYIHRYGDFDGFFTRSNVSLLTKATEKQ